MWCVFCYSNKTHITSVWLPSILPLNWESSKTSCVQHLQLSVPIPLSGFWDHLVKIWGLSEVWLRFLKSLKVEKSLTKIIKNCHNFWANNPILMPYGIKNLQNILKVVFFYYSKAHFNNFLRYCTIKASPGFAGPANACAFKCLDL